MCVCVCRGWRVLEERDSGWGQAGDGQQWGSGPVDRRGRWGEGPREGLQKNTDSF